MGRLAAFKLRHSQARPLENGQQEHAAPEEMTGQEDAIHGDKAIVIPDSQEQGEQEGGRPADAQVEINRLLDLEPRNNKAEAQAKIRPSPKAKHTARSQLIQSMLSRQRPTSYLRSFDAQRSEAAPPRKRSAKGTGKGKDKGKGTGAADQGDGQGKHRPSAKRQRSAQVLERPMDKTRRRISSKSAGNNVGSRPSIATQPDLARCSKTATSTVGAAGLDVATGPRSEQASRSSIPSNRPGGLSSADTAIPDALHTQPAGRRRFDLQHASKSAKTNEWHQFLPTFPIAVQEKWKAISALPGLGSNKVKLKQFMQQMYWDSGCDVGNELFRLVVKQTNLEMQNEDALWVSWKKFCDEEGEAEAKEMRENGTVQTRDHPQLKDGKQYKLHRDWSRSSIMTEINGTLEKTFASTPEANVLIRQILPVAHDSSDVREKTFRRKPERLVPEKTASQECADQAEEVLRALTRVLPEINDWLDVSQASKFTKDLRRQLLTIKTEIHACQKLFAHVSSEKQRGQFPPEDTCEGVREKCCRAAVLIKQSKTFMLLLRQNMQAEEQMTGISFNFPGKKKQNSRWCCRRD